ncbi:MAG: FAD-dependent oxidoreductase [Pirellulales bacterium]
MIPSNQPTPCTRFRWSRLGFLGAILLFHHGLASWVAAQQTTRVTPERNITSSFGNDNGSYDVVIYGGTSAGIAAAVQVKRMGRSVVVIEPTSRIGGLTTGGLGSTDMGNKGAIGGIAREFYQRINRYYRDPARWKWQSWEEYRETMSHTAWNEETMWHFEPSAALSVMEDFVRELKIPIHYGERLNRNPVEAGKPRVEGVSMGMGRILSIGMESGKTYRGQVFIDATYEGDLMAGAGVDTTVGRESNDMFDETLSGVQTSQAKHHQFKPGVDPYVKPGQKESSLLPGINPTGPGKEGQGDDRIQAYCFRMCLTDHPENRIPFSKPAHYDPLDYELLLRNFEAGATNIPWIKTPMPNRKTDNNNKRGFSTDFIGQNYNYPEASYTRREESIQRHRAYQQGLMWTLANHPRVPAQIRQEVSRWGTCRDEFERSDGWQAQLYIREARRMIGDYVMTQHNCQGKVTAKRPIGLGAYGMDSHHVQRYIDKSGHVQNEGDVEVSGFSPYPIDYGSIVSRNKQCSNLLVPVCLSASHIAFGSIRMEPVFMVLGQSAATAAVQSIETGTAVQDIDYHKLRKRLIEDRQVLVWVEP